MSPEEKGPESILDQTLSEVRNDTPDPAQVRKAADRVWARVSQEAAGVTAEPETIRNCADFQALIPAWREKRLSPARAMLLEDHMHECPACRKAAAGERVVEIRRKPAMTPTWRWAMAAGIVAAIGLSAWLVSEFAIPGGTGARATVYATNGPIYRVVNGSSFQLAKDSAIGEAERIRTAKEAGAMIRLHDGSLVEMAERTELSLSRRRSGTTIHLDRGAVIVQAAKQRNGHLFVATDDCTVSVKGTIFSVNHGLKGSRVSVVEGEVHVDQGDQTKVLRAGDQASTSDALTPIPVETDIAWSRDFDKYAALLKEFATIRKKIEALPGSGLRYDSTLLDLVPAATQFYVAIPNIGQTVADAHRIFREQMAQSELLQQWWAERTKSAEADAKLTSALERLRAFSSYLGPEIVVAMVPNAAGKLDSPLILAQVTGSGFRDYLVKEVAAINAEAKRGGLRIVDDPLRVIPVGADEMLVWTGNGILAAAKDPALLQAAASPASGAFRRTAFGARILQAYQDGVSWLICADMQTVLAREAKDPEGLKRSGFGDIRYLVVQRKEVTGKTENRAELSFAHPRQGVASWLAGPAPIRALDFISQDAGFVSAFAIKEPRLALEDVFQMAQGKGADAWRGLAEFEAKTGVSVRNELIAPLGGEIAFAVDGPMLPVPSFKVVAEVNDPKTFVGAIEKVVAAVNKEGAQHGFEVKLAQEQVSGKTYWTVTGPKSIEVHFTFDNGFLIAAPSRDLLVRSLQYRATGYSLPKSPKFAAMLPADGHTNFSGMVYHAMGSVLQPFVGRTLTPEQQKALKAIAGDEPTLVLLYGEQDRIEVASRGTFFGLRPEQMLGLPGFGPQRQKARAERHVNPL